MSEEYLVDLGVDTNPLVPEANSSKLEFHGDQVQSSADELKMINDLSNEAKIGKH